MDDCSESSAFSNEEEAECPGPLYRVKLFVMGDLGSGKSSVVQSLIGPRAKTVETPTEGVAVDLWYPFKNNSCESLLKRKLSKEERHLTLEIWDLSGRQVCQGVHQVYLTPGALYIVVYNWVDQTSRDSVLPIVDAIQYRVPGSCILLVSTRLDEDKGDTGKHNLLDTLRQNEQTQQAVIKSHIHDLRLQGSTGDVRKEVDVLETLLNKRPQITQKVFTFSAITGKGLQELRIEILTKTLNCDIFSHVNRPVQSDTIYLYDEILKLREKCNILIPWELFKELISKEHVWTDKQLDEDIAFLNIVGGVLDFRTQIHEDGKIDDKRFICVHPAAFANALCLYHVDDDKKAFKFEAQRFWPRRSGFKKPDPHVLVRALECIPSEGLIREVLFPLLWQDTWLTIDQIQHMLHVLRHLGLLVPHLPAKNHCEGLALPDFPSLSVCLRHYAPLMDKLPDNRPQLNWTPKPFDGDLQITWRYDFPFDAPPGVIKRLTMCFRNIIHGSTYIHAWKYGILLRLGETLVCVQHEDKYVDISCRINGDELGREVEATRTLWMTMATFLHTANSFLKQWPGLILRHDIRALGKQFYMDENDDGETIFPVIAGLLQYQRSQYMTCSVGDNHQELDLGLLFPYSEAKSCNSVSEWINVILKEKAQLPTVINSVVETRNKINENMSPGSVKLKKKKKNVEVKWNLEDIKADKYITNEPPKEARKVSTAVDPERKISTTEESNRKVSSIVDSNGIESESKVNDLKVSEKKDDASEANNKFSNASSEEKTDAVVEITSQAAVCIGGRFLTEEEEISEATKVASGFVAAIMASAVAEYLAVEFSDNHDYHHLITTAQVAAAKVTAEAAMATQTGNIDGAAKAVFHAAKAVQDVMADSKLNPRSPIHSKFCIVL